MSATIASLGEWLRRAQEHAQQREVGLAEQAFQRVLELDPARLEALEYLVGLAYHRRRPEQALALLQSATQAPDAPAALWVELGKLHERLNDPAAAQSALERALKLAPHDYYAALHLGQALEARGEMAAARSAFFRAITHAQSAGQWLDEASTLAALRPRVQHAMRVVEDGRRAVLDEIYAPLAARHGLAAMARVRQCLDGVLGLRQDTPPDPRQQPKYLYFPSIPSTAFFERRLFPWFEALEASTDAIEAELDAVLARRADIQPFLDLSGEARREDYLANAQNPDDPRWDAYFFYRHGERFDAHHREAPLTSAAIDATPLARIPGHAPEICYSMLTAGTHILPHHGDSNVRVVVHLPLKVPADCALHVSGEYHHWQRGRAMAFDDTYRHEAWNRGESLRVILLMDSWNPYLSPVEREAMAAVIAALGLYNRSLKAGWA